MATKKTTTKKATTTKVTKPKATRPKQRVLKKQVKKTGQEPASKDDKKLSALDAAVKVLSTSKDPMNSKQLIVAMAARKLWTSPGGKTPHATLYSAILREVNAKGKDARFTKADKGLFTTNG